MGLSEASYQQLVERCGAVAARAGLDVTVREHRDAQVVTFSREGLVRGFLFANTSLEAAARCGRLPLYLDVQLGPFAQWWPTATPHASAQTLTHGLY